jgi:hypothetical protein
MEPLIFPERIRMALDVQMVILQLRAAWEELIKGHFGNDIIDELFDLFKKKIVESSFLSQSSVMPMLEIYVLLKRKIY